MRRLVSASPILNRTSTAARSVVIGTVLLMSACSVSTSKMPSIPDAKERVTAYYESGGYAKDFAKVVAQARRHLELQLGAAQASRDGKKLAIVLDIDETALSNYEFERKIDYGYDAGLFNEWVEKATAPALEPTLEFYRYASEKGVSIFFITGRRERERAATEKNLIAVGYKGWARLHAKPDDHKATSAVFKAEVRKQILEEGYRIVLNMGDQESDLAGGYAEKTFLLPNPFYRVP